MREIFTDIIYKFKDKHPFSTFIFKYLGNPEMKGPMDVYNLCMNSLLSLKLLPNESLINKYKQSKFNRILNRFPSLDKINKELDTFQMSDKTYDYLKRTYL